MDLVKDNTRKIYFRYLFFSFLSALVSSIYSVVDMIVVGQYLGSTGVAALAVVAPLWNIIYSLGLLTGLGGAILWIKAKGEEKSQKELNEFFTLSIILTSIVCVILWITIWVFEDQILSLFGASENLLPLAKDYLYPVKFAIPVFLFNQVLAAFLRNDKDPKLATIAILCGGVINIAGDYLLVFTANMGIAGAGIATVGCNAVSVLIMLIHFLKKRNTLKFGKITHPFTKTKDILINGFPAFFTDVSMGIITIVFNTQILRFFDEDTLSVYGIIINVNTFVQCCGYGVGQASQPLFSINYGAKQYSRVKKFLKYSLITIGVISAIWLFATLTFPNGFINLFMKPNDHVLSIAPAIIRKYCLVFAFLPVNVVAIYYFQSILHPKFSLLLSFLRGLILFVPLLFLLPLISPDMIWFAPLITEIVVFGISIIYMIKVTRSFTKPKEEKNSKISCSNQA